MSSVTCCSCDTISSKSDSSASDDQNDTLVRITVSHALNEIQPNSMVKQSAPIVECIRCGHSLNTNNAIFVTVNPPFIQQRSKISISVNDGVNCNKCMLPESLHCRKISETDEASPDSAKETSSLGIPSTDISNDSLVDAEEIRMEGYHASTLDDDMNLNGRMVLHQNQYHRSENICSNSCTDCHIAVIRECNRAESRVTDLPEVITLMIQFPVSSEWNQSNDSQDQPDVSKGDVGVSDSILGIFREASVIAVSGGIGITGSGKYNKNIPDLDPEAEAAYQSHLRNLIPCTHCGRTFNPDRVLVHENVCVERSRKKITRKR